VILGGEVPAALDLPQLGAQVPRQPLPVWQPLERVGGAPHHPRRHLQVAQPVGDLEGVGHVQPVHLPASAAAPP
jgi:hypothetical protein